MIWLPLLIMTLLAALYLAGSLKSSPKVLAASFAAFAALAFSIYSLIGRPDLTAPGALKPYQPPAAPSGPSQAEIDAAQALTPEQRAEMILGMVDSLAAKLEDAPDNPQGWARLIRARYVLGQDELAQADIARVKEIYKTNPELAAKILSAAAPQ